MFWSHHTLATEYEEQTYACHSHTCLSCLTMNLNFLFEYDLLQKYYVPQVQPDWGLNSWSPAHGSTFHVTKSPALTTPLSVTFIHSSGLVGYEYCIIHLYLLFYSSSASYSAWMTGVLECFSPLWTCTKAMLLSIGLQMLIEITQMVECSAKWECLSVPIVDLFVLFTELFHRDFSPATKITGQN